MEKILTTKQKWAYAHWCLCPGFLWIINPFNWIAMAVTVININYWYAMFSEFIDRLILPSAGHRFAVTFLSGALYILVCAAVSYACVYVFSRVLIFLFDRDKESQMHYKRCHICHDFICFCCDKENCNARRPND